jgi:hypothetical protein
MISGVGNNYYLYEIFSGVGDIEINTNPSNQTRTIIYGAASISRKQYLGKVS